MPPLSGVELYREAMETSIDGMAILDADGRYVYLNRAHHEVYGYEEGELIGESWRKLYGREEVERLEDEVLPKLRSQGGWRGRAVGRRKDGSTFPQELSLSRLEDGGTVCVVRDVSELEAALERERKALREKEMVMDAVPEIIYRVDKDGRLVEVNWRAVDETGYTRKELEGSDALEFFPEEEREKVASKIREAYEEGLSKEGASLLTKGGESVPYQWSATPLEGEGGEVLGLVGVGRNVERQREERRRREFLHSLLRHDIGNQLTAARGYLELALDETSGEAGDMVKEALGSVESSTRLIEKVGKLLEAGGEDGSEVDLGRLVRRAVEEVEPWAGSYDIDLTRPEGSMEVLGGPLLEDLFLNLLENAVRHSGCDEVAINLEDRDGVCVASVEDDGGGLPGEVEEDVFRRGFSWGERAGEGCGLYLVETIAESYGGRVEAGDSPMGGAGFYVFLEKP